MQLVFNTCSFPSCTSLGDGEREAEARMSGVGKGGQELPLRCVFPQFLSSYSILDKGAMSPPWWVPPAPGPVRVPWGPPWPRWALEIPAFPDNDGSGAENSLGSWGLRQEAAQTG